jgi:integrase
MKNLYEKSDGRLYYRRKVKGRDQYIRLPAKTHPDFFIAYNEAANEVVRRVPAKGTLAALVADYRASSDFKAIKSDRTKENYRRYLDQIEREHGLRSVRGVKPYIVRKLRDEMQDTPGKANNWLNVFKTLMNYAALNDWRHDNPAAPVKMLPIGEYEPWPADVLTAALAAASPTTRLILITGLCSGARVGDCIRMQHRWHDGHIMEFTAAKNKADVAVPMHPLWLGEIAGLPRRAVTILYDRQGKPFTSPRAIEERVRDLLDKIGEERQFVFHGLRKNAACYLAETGLNDSEIGAIVGMTPQTVRHYTKRRRAYMIAQSVAERIKRGDVLQLEAVRAAGER